jgi:hypothetical protein
MTLVNNKIQQQSWRSFDSHGKEHKNKYGAVVESHYNLQEQPTQHSLKVMMTHNPQPIHITPDEPDKMT